MNTFSCCSKFWNYRKNEYFWYQWMNKHWADLRYIKSKFQLYYDFLQSIKNHVYDISINYDIMLDKTLLYKNEILAKDIESFCYSSYQIVYLVNNELYYHSENQLKVKVADSVGYYEFNRYLAYMINNLLYVCREDNIFEVDEIITDAVKVQYTEFSRYILYRSGEVSIKTKDKEMWFFCFKEIIDIQIYNYFILIIEKSLIYVVSLVSDCIAVEIPYSGTLRFTENNLLLLNDIPQIIDFKQKCLISII